MRGFLAVANLSANRESLGGCNRPALAFNEGNMSNERKKLSDILHNGEGDAFRNRWNSTVAAEDIGPLPPGEYVCRILSGELFQSKQETPGYKLALQVVEGDFAGRRCWADWWLTPAALPMTKRDL